MKKGLLFLSGILTAFAGFAQVEVEEVYQMTSSGMSIEDIINEQQMLTSGSTKEKHYQKVWSRNNYVNFNYQSSTLSPQGDYPTGLPAEYGQKYAENMKSNWGFGLAVGHSYKLLKTPVKNIFQVNIDYNPVELLVNHYGATNGGYYSVDTDADDYYYYPWNLQKYLFSYGMSVGPSITLAPFTLLNIEQLDFLKLNVYYHIGYQVSLLFTPNQKKEEFAVGTDQWGYDTMKDNLKLDIGHGIISAFGFNLSWKSIGIGYEYYYSPNTFISLNKTDFGKSNHKFHNSNNRVYIQLRM